MGDNKFLRQFSGGIEQKDVSFVDTVLLLVRRRAVIPVLLAIADVMTSLLHSANSWKKQTNFCAV